MLIVPESEWRSRHNESKQALIDHFNQEMEKILNANASKDKYWILGKTRFPEEFGGKVGRVFLEAFDEKPPLVKQSFVYEVDNRRGVKTLLWVMHPDNTLSFPTLQKSISVAH